MEDNCTFPPLAEHFQYFGLVNWESADEKDDTEVGENKSYGTIADEDEAGLLTLSYFMK